MRASYYPPTHREPKFHCIHCGVYASQHWVPLFTGAQHQAGGPTDFEASYCSHCSKASFWYQRKMIVPAEAPVQPPHTDLPDDCRHEYIEAREIFARSPRAAAALLRLCIQKLMPHLGMKGKNINDDIATLVANGLPIHVQRALDYCRVVGNNAVHPGEIDLSGTPEVAQRLFEMINFIVEDRITRPKEIDEMYHRLPEESRKAIEKRDGTGSTPTA